MTQPRRLIEMADTSAELREDLERARALDVGYDVDAGAARLQAALDVPQATGAAATAASGKRALWWIIGGTAIGGAVLAVYLAVPATPSEPAASMPRSSDAREVVGAVPTIEPFEASAEHDEAARDEPIPSPESIAEADEQPAAPEQTAPELQAPARPKPAVSREPDDEDDRLAAEMAATHAAKKALANDPARALQLVREADGAFPNGLFATDRTAIATLARIALGDETAASAAEAFLRDHPRHPHAQRIRKALDHRAPCDSSVSQCEGSGDGVSVSTTGG